ncbi:hypothetical protein FRB98_002921 [Tulasnella sp. 332]|nr:hypothetical protein FRB98_002921 [Tulasnella sp. 332]
MAESYSVSLWGRTRLSQYLAFPSLSDVTPGLLSPLTTPGPSFAIPLWDRMQLSKCLANLMLSLSVAFFEVPTADTDESGCRLPNIQLQPGFDTRHSLLGRHYRMHRSAFTNAIRRAR